MFDNCEKAILILKNTKDGNDLSPLHLWIVQEAVNGGLNEAGLKIFDKIYNDCSQNKYIKPFHFEVEHITKDHEGYIYFKGKQVEHFTFRGVGSAEREKKATEQVARICLELEKEGREITTANYLKRCETASV